MGRSTVARILIGFKYSLKRIHFLPERRNILNTVGIRYEYARIFLTLQAELEEEGFIFIYEVGFNGSMRAIYERSPLGSPSVLEIPHLRSRNISTCCTLNKNGILSYNSRDSAYTAIQFEGFLRNLVEKLHAVNNTRAVLVMDNVAFNKCPTIRNFIQESGFKLTF